MRLGQSSRLSFHPAAVPTDAKLLPLLQQVYYKVESPGWVKHLHTHALQEVFSSSPSLGFWYNHTISHVLTLLSLPPISSWRFLPLVLSTKWV